MTTPYLSVERYKTLGYGIDLSNVPDYELDSIIMSSSATVDSYCSVPLIPQEHSFRGGSITNEQQPWTLGTDVVRGTRRFYPYHRPIKAISSFSIQVTNQINVTVGPNDLYVNVPQNYFELISLAAVTFGVFPVGLVPNLGLHTPVAKATYTYGYEFQVTNETLDETDANLFRGNNGCWDPSIVPVVRTNGTVASPSLYTVDYFDGSVKFAVAPNAVVTADYTYTLPAAIAAATGEIVTQALSDRELARKGMHGLAAIQVQDMSIRRSFRGGSVPGELAQAVPDNAARLLEGFRFRTMR